MGKELEREAEETNEQFKAQVFAANPKLYHDLFEKKEEQPFDEVEFPETEAEFKALYASMMREGMPIAE
jgi:hypothetical protein